MSAKSAILLLAVVGLLSACSVEDENSTERCSLDLTCSGELVCYRGFCVESDEPFVAAEDAGQRADASKVETPSVVSSSTDAAAATAAASTADSALPAATVPPSNAAPSSADAGRAPEVQSGGQQPSAPSGAAMGGAPDKATPEAPPPMQTPAPLPVSPPEAEAPSAGAPASWLTDFVEVGLLPVYVLNCVPKCLTLEPTKECEQCLEKALKGEGKKVECEGGRGRGNRANCVVNDCTTDDECES